MVGLISKKLLFKFKFWYLKFNGQFFFNFFFESLKKPKLEKPEFLFMPLHLAILILILSQLKTHKKESSRLFGNKKLFYCFLFHNINAYVDCQRIHKQLNLCQYCKTNSKNQDVQLPMAQTCRWIVKNDKIAVILLNLASKNVRQWERNEAAACLDRCNCTIRCKSRKTKKKGYRGMEDHFRVLKKYSLW